MAKKIKEIKVVVQNGTIINDKMMRKGVTVWECDSNKLTLANYRRNYGHDDSLPYQADIEFNGKIVGTVCNDGWGGMSDIHFANNEGQASVEGLFDNIYWNLGTEKKPMVVKFSLDVALDLVAETMDCYVK